MLAQEPTESVECVAGYTRPDTRTSTGLFVCVCVYVRECVRVCESVDLLDLLLRLLEGQVDDLFFLHKRLVVLLPTHVVASDPRPQDGGGGAGGGVERVRVMRLSFRVYLCSCAYVCSCVHARV